jgi:hypothetical protein
MAAAVPHACRARYFLSSLTRQKKDTSTISHDSREFHNAWMFPKIRIQCTYRSSYSYPCS